jgi:hypothetical protein
MVSVPALAEEVTLDVPVSSEPDDEDEDAAAPVEALAEVPALEPPQPPTASASAARASAVPARPRVAPTGPFRRDPLNIAVPIAGAAVVVRVAVSAVVLRDPAAATARRG